MRIDACNRGLHMQKSLGITRRVFRFAPAGASGALSETKPCFASLLHQLLDRTGRLMNVRQPSEVC